MAEWCSGFFVGPYVEFVDADRVGLPEEGAGDRGASAEFLCCSLTGGPSFSRAGRAGPRHVFWCRGSTDEATAGAFSGCGRSYVTADLSRVDSADEARWFTTTYAPVLEWLARHYGQPPGVRWGWCGTGTSSDLRSSLRLGRRTRPNEGLRLTADADVLHGATSRSSGGSRWAWRPARGVRRL